MSESSYEFLGKRIWQLQAVSVGRLSVTGGGQHLRMGHSLWASFFGTAWLACYFWERVVTVGGKQPDLKDGDSSLSQPEAAVQGCSC